MKPAALFLFRQPPKLTKIFGLLAAFGLALPAVAVAQTSSSSSRSLQPSQLKTVQQLVVAGQPSLNNLAVLPDGRWLVCQGQQALILPAPSPTAAVASAKTAATGATLPTGDCNHWSISESGMWLAIWRPQLQEVQIWSLSGDSTQVSEAQQSQKAQQRLKVKNWQGMGFVAGLLWVLDSQSFVSLSPITGNSELVTLEDSNDNGDTAQSTTTKDADAPTAFYGSPNGQYAVVQRGQKVQLVQMPTLKVRSAVVCENQPCVLKNVHFSLDSKRAVVLIDDKLHGLRDAYPSTTILRSIANKSAAGQASQVNPSNEANAKNTLPLGFPLSDNTAVTLEQDKLLVRDYQTGRRESTLLAGVQAPAALYKGGLLLASQGQIIDYSLTRKSFKRYQLTGPARSAGLDSKNRLVLLRQNGQLMVDQQVVTGYYSALSSRNRLNWILAKTGQGKLYVLENGVLKALPSLAQADNIAVNHWGSEAVVWNKQRFSVISLKEQKQLVVDQIADSAVQAEALKQTSLELMLSPDAQRLYVLPSAAGDHVQSFVINLGNKKRQPLSQLFGERHHISQLQISSLGVHALLVKPSNRNSYLSLYAPKEKKPYVSLANVGSGFSFSQDGLLLAVPMRQDTGIVVKVLDVRSGKTTAVSPPLNYWPSLLVWSADRTRLVVGAGVLGSTAGVTVFGF